MPNPPASPGPERRRPASVEDLVRRAAAAPRRRAQIRLVNALVRRAGKGLAAGDVFRRLVAAGPTGPRLALDFFTRLPGKPPQELVTTALMLIKQKAGPAAVRIAAAGKLLDVLPDSPEMVRPIVTAITAGHSAAAALERLVRLQSRVRKCETLDRIVAATEAASPLKCPKCAVKLPRTKLIEHLWQKHKLVWEQGKVRAPQALLEQTMNAAGKTTAEPDPARIDAAFRQTTLYFPDVPPRQVFQALAARGSAHPAQLQPLLDRAADDRCGLCPVCLSALPDPIPALPPPAPVGGGRVAAEGYEVEVDDAPTGRSVFVTTREGTTTDPGKRVAPRMLAVYVGGPLLLIAVGAVVVLAPHLALPVGGGLLAAGWLVYAAVRMLRKPLPDPIDEAVERAWSDVVPGIGRKPAAVRFLVRLCRASLGVGDPGERTPSVWDLVEQAAVLADRGGVHLQLLAAARVLQVCDGAAGGREKVAAMMKVFEPFFRGELPIAYAEAAGEVVFAGRALTSGEAGRLAVLLIGTAFETGYLPADLAAVTRFAPWLRRVLADPSDLHLRALYAVWRGRHQKRWTEIGPAQTVFEMAEGSPVVAKKVLALYPDVLLCPEVDDVVERELGPVVVCTSGVVAGGATVADPDAPVQLSANGRDLVFGTHRIGLDRKMPNRVALGLRGWVKFRARVLMPLAEQIERPAATGTGRSVGVLSHLTVTCGLCGCVAVVRKGQLGERWDVIASGRA